MGSIGSLALIGVLLFILSLACGLLNCACGIGSYLLGKKPEKPSVFDANMKYIWRGLLISFVLVIIGELFKI